MPLSPPRLRALHVDPSFQLIKVVDWDQSLGELFDLIGYGYHSGE